MPVSFAARLAGLVGAAVLLGAPAVRARTDGDSLICGPAACHHVLRTEHAWMAGVINRQVPRSPTLQRLLARVAQHRVFVYIDVADGRQRSWDGRIRFITATSGYRYVRVDVKRLPETSAAAVLAHELQHAVEIATGAVTTQPEFDALFRRIGFRAPAGLVSGAVEQYDTEAAIRAGLDTYRELRLVTSPSHERVTPLSPAEYVHHATGGRGDRRPSR